jgi:predicted HTH transcriptional regulator
METDARSEDYLLERKSKNDLRDLLKTMVAFANSVRPGHVATILIGERDDGTPEDIDPDSIQKTVRKEAPFSITFPGQIFEPPREKDIVIDFSVHEIYDERNGRCITFAYPDTELGQQLSSTLNITNPVR